MRVKYPKHISRLIDVFWEYVYRDAEDHSVKPREDAPDEAKQAKREYDEWAAQNKFRMEGCDG